MSMLPAEVLSALSQLLQALQSADNVVRSQAEEQLSQDWVQTRPEMLLMGFVESIQNTVSDENVRSSGHYHISPKSD